MFDSPGVQEDILEIFVEAQARAFERRSAHLLGWSAAKTAGQKAASASYRARNREKERARVKEWKQRQLEFIRKTRRAA